MTMSGAVKQPFRFSTKPYDDKAGLYDFGYRSYAPTLARWLSRDPVGESAGKNLYAYNKNNPAMRIDRLGLDSSYPAPGPAPLTPTPPPAPRTGGGTEFPTPTGLPPLP